MQKQYILTEEEYNELCGCYDDELPSERIKELENENFDLCIKVHELQTQLEAYREQNKMLNQILAKKCDIPYIDKKRGF